MFKKKGLFLLASAVTALASLAGSAEAAVLGSRTGITRLGSRTVSNQINFSLLSRDFLSPNNPVLFEDLLLGSSDAGITFTSNSANDPDFDDFVDRLTNGESDYISVQISLVNGGGSTIGRREKDFFNLPTTDFQGSSISSIDLIFNQLSFDTPGRNPNRDGIWTSISGDYTIVVNAEPKSVPEPMSTSAILIAAIAGGTMLKKRR